jgi:hypothetical protein
MRAFPRIQSLPLVVTMALSGVTPTLAQQSFQSQLTGTWKLTASYELFTNGHKTESFGKNPQGVAEFTPGGTFIILLMDGDRAAKPGTPPFDPVEPALALYATYTVNDQNKTYTYHVQQSTFPQWNGVSRTSTVTEISPTVLKVTAEAIHDPRAGDFVPHLEFERMK